MAANTKLDLSLASGDGYFSTWGDYSATDQVGKENTTDENAPFTLLSIKDTANQGLGTVAVSGSTYELTGINARITDITAVGSTKKWSIDTTGADGLKTLVASDQADLIKAVKGADGFTITTGSGKDSLDISGLASAAAVTDYDYASDVIKVGNVGTPEALISSAGLIEGTNGTASLTLNATSGYYKAVLTTNGASANTVRVWKGGSDAVTIDASSESDALVMVTGEKADTLLGGSKADKLYARTEGAYAFGGAGTDLITLEDGNTTTRQYVAISTDSGKDSVVAFGAAGFADTDDVLVLRDGSITDLKFTADATGTVIKNDGGSASLGGVADATANAKLLIQEGTAEASKVAMVNAAGNGYVVTAGGSDIADYYISTGKVGKVDFTAIEDNVVAELSNLGNFEDNATFKGIDSITGGKGNSTLIGDGEVKNYIAAAGGNTTLWGGGASNDTLVGVAGSVDAFFVGLRDGKDTIDGFAFGTTDTADTLYMMNSPATSIKKDSSKLTFTFADGSSVDMANAAATNTIKFSTDGTTKQVATIGKSSEDNKITYGSDVDMFFGGSKTDTLMVEESYDGSSVDIRLNNTLSQSYASIDVVNASAYDGKAFIAGNDTDAEMLIGGKGKTTLWGGLGGSDTLKGTNGDVTGFYFGKNNGEDVVTYSDSDDKVVFYDFANTDLTAIDTTGSQLKFTFNDGSSLQIQNYTSGSVQTFEFTNGTWTYDKSTKTFTQTK